MFLKQVPLYASLMLLTACGARPWVPYLEPAPGTDTAQLRVITNGEVRGGVYDGCVGNEQGLAKAGRFYGDHLPAINYPQSPVVPPRLDMPARFAPKLSDYLGATRMAEGNYSEMVAEYRVPAGKPFVLVLQTLQAGSYGSSYMQCSEQAGVFTFEKGKNYEVYLGINSVTSNDGTTQVKCPFVGYELVSFGKQGFSLPSMLQPKAPSGQKCSVR
ncbi:MULTISPECIES: amidase [Pseudomonas]|uniref:amidase n=1 Tax=Pseudomonas TaxID=286 RepID=UPI000CD56A74|nr:MULTISPECIES: amidase [Pseudomonas]RBH53628.1 amidase [Pseudomonas sp. MWU13-2860]